VGGVRAGACRGRWRSGILFLSPTALERLAQVDHVVFDKTGTLTLGRPELVVAPDDPEARQLAASLALNSRHPLTRALVRAIPEAIPAERVVEHPGAGLESDGVRLGSATFCGVANPPDDGRSELWLSRPAHLPVRFAFADRLRPDASATVAALRRSGLAVEVLSGDRQAAVAEAASAAGITEWRSGVTPAEKAQRLADLAAQGKRVLMVGDGLNDAPALAAAHASISPTTAAEATQSAADAVFQGDALGPVAEILDAHVPEGIPLARTSAGLAMQGEKPYGAMADGSVKSPQAIADPLGPTNTMYGDFTHLALLEGIVTHTHFQESERPGRGRFPGRPGRDRSGGSAEVDAHAGGFCGTSLRYWLSGRSHTILPAVTAIKNRRNGMRSEPAVRPAISKNGLGMAESTNSVGMPPLSMTTWLTRRTRSSPLWDQRGPGTPPPRTPSTPPRAAGPGAAERRAAPRLGRPERQRLPARAHPPRRVGGQEARRPQRAGEVLADRRDALRRCRSGGPRPPRRPPPRPAPRERTFPPGRPPRRARA